MWITSCIKSSSDLIMFKKSLKLVEHTALDECSLLVWHRLSTVCRKMIEHCVKASPFNQVFLWFSAVYPVGWWDRFLKQAICLLPDSYHSWTSSHLNSSCKNFAFETPSPNNLKFIGVDYTRWKIQTFILTCWMIFCVLHRFWATDFESDSKNHVADSERCLFI